MTRNGLHLVLALLLAMVMGLGACGRKGPLERPPNAEKRATDASAPDGKESDKPQRRFILDRLVR